MLRKLYKQEFISLYKTMLPLYFVLVGLSLLTRVFSYIKNDQKGILAFWKTVTATLSVAGIIAVFVVGSVVVIVRFYQNLLTKQGYLTFTLPFKAHNHIFCKLLCGIVVMLTNAVVAVGSVVLMLGTKENMTKIFEFINEFINSYFATTGKANGIATMIEVPIMIVLSICTTLLMFYASMAIGQQFKNKILGSVIAYFCIYAVIQAINTFILVIATITGFDAAESIFKNATFTTITQGFMAFIFFIIITQGIIYYCITNYFLSKKLNLE